MKGFMSSLNQKTYQMKEKMGSSSNKTQDLDYAGLKVRIETAAKKIATIQQHIQKVVDNYKSVQVLQSELATEFLFLYSAGPVQGAMKSYEDAINHFNEVQQSFAERVRETISEPINTYLEIFKDVKKRMEELSKRRVDMDRYNERRLKMAEKTTGSKEKLPETDAKYRHSKDLYESLLNEMKVDMKALDDDINTFISPVFAAFSKFHSEFLIEVNKIFGAIPPQCSQVNIEAIHSHQSVVTPLEFSAMMNKNVTASGPSSSYSGTQTASAPATEKPLPARPMPSAPAAARARGLFNFTASDSTELSFNTGDILNIINRRGDWWDAELNGKRGQIPANYVELI